jgi:hypothetical protein
VYVPTRHAGTDYSNLAIDILAMVEYTVSIIILSSISLRPLLRKLYKVATVSHSTPFSPGTNPYDSEMTHKRGMSSPHLSKLWRKGPMNDGGIYPTDNVQPAYGSEVELTDIEMGRIYKTEEIRVISTHE